MRIRIKTPSKATIKRQVTKAIRQSLICPRCGHKLPTTYAATTTCSRCGQRISINL